MPDLVAFDWAYLNGLRNGDSETEQHFWNHFGRHLGVKLRRRLRSVELIEDIRQETLLRVLSSVKAGEIQHPERLGAYVNSVCNNVLREFVRGEERHPNTAIPSEEREDESEDIETTLISREQKEIVTTALDELSPRDRKVLCLVCFEGRDRGEVCRLMGVDPAYLRVLLHRALTRVRELVAKRSGKDAHEVQ